MADELISLSQNLISPRYAKPSDFGKADTSKMTEGTDKLITLSATQVSPRSIEDGGAGGYGSPVGADPETKKAAAFKPDTSKGESDTPDKDVAGGWYVNFNDGSACWAGSKPLPK